MKTSNKLLLGAFVLVLLAQIAVNVVVKREINKFSEHPVKDTKEIRIESKHGGDSIVIRQIN